MRLEITYLLDVIRYILDDKLHNVPLPFEEMDWKWLITFAKRHSILPVLYYGVKELPEEYRPESTLWAKLDYYAMHGITIGVNQEEATKEIEQTFEEKGIDLLAIKGVCTRQRYPFPELRTMGDIDLLYRAAQTKKMQDTMKTLGYQDGEEGRKHDSFFRPPCIGIEMHRKLLAADSKYYSYYEDIWERVQLREGYQCIYHMSLEDEYIYSILHLVEHFLNGGIGIRFVMDVYVYNHLKDMNWDYIEVELRKLGLLEFYKNISRLTEIWFGDRNRQTEDDELIKQLEAYILSNGTFGTSRNAAATAVAKEGRTKFLLQTVFPNLENMKTMFPWLSKWPILLPYSWVLRGVRSVLFRRKNIKIQLAQYQQGDQKYGDKLKTFYGKCGL